MGSGKKAQHLRVCTTLAEDPYSQHPPGGADVLFWTPWVPALMCEHTHKQAQTHTLIN